MNSRTLGGDKPTKLNLQSMSSSLEVLERGLSEYHGRHDATKAAYEKARDELRRREGMVSELRELYLTSVLPVLEEGLRKLFVNEKAWAIQDDVVVATEKPEGWWHVQVYVTDPSALVELRPSSAAPLQPGSSPAPTLQWSVVGGGSMPTFRPTHSGDRIIVADGLLERWPHPVTAVLDACLLKGEVSFNVFTGEMSGPVVRMHPDREAGLRSGSKK